MLLLDLPSLPSSFPALDLSGLLLFAVFSLWLTSNCANTIPSLLVRVFLHCWILLLGPNFGLFPTGRFQLVLGMLLLRLPLCDFLEFPVFRCSNFLLVLVLLGTALARQILSPLLFLSPLAPSPLLPLYPFPLPLLRNSSLLLDALLFLVIRALLAFALFCNELLCCLFLFAKEWCF